MQSSWNNTHTETGVLLQHDIVPISPYRPLYSALSLSLVVGCRVPFSVCIFLVINCAPVVHAKKRNDTDRVIK